MSQIPDAFQFEWDEQKNSINKKKHGISFETAMHVFNDPLRLDFFDEIHSVEEDRFITIGKVEDILFVVYTLRQDATRIISARIATPRERRLYHDS